MTDRIPCLFITHNRLQYSKIALEALMECGDVDILVFDNNSDKETVDWLKGLRVEQVHLHYKNIGVAGAMNWFFEQTEKSEFVAKVDNDTVIQDGDISKLKTILIENNLDCVQPKHFIIPATNKDGWDGFIKGKKQIGNGLYENSYVGGSGIVIRRSAIKGNLNEGLGVLRGWFDYQKQHLEIRKAFYDKIEIKLLDEKGYDDYKDYYKQTGRC